MAKEQVVERHHRWRLSKRVGMNPLRKDALWHSTNHDGKSGCGFGSEYWGHTYQGTFAYPEEGRICPRCLNRKNWELPTRGNTA